MRIKQRDSLRALVSFEGSFAALQQSLRGLPYDYEGDAVVLTCEHLARAVRRYLGNEFTAAELETWAELIEKRPGIE
jgi:hypothetical protein